MTREITISETYKFLDDSILQQYNESVKSSYNSEKARATLTQFGSRNGELTGSHPFMLVHLQNSSLIPGRIATRQDLETALRFGLNLSGHYVDFGLALKTAGDYYTPNDLLAKNLAWQLGQRAIKLKEGKFIPISKLALKENENSAYGLVFDLNEDEKEVEDLSKQKWIYSKNPQGLTRTHLDRYGYWISDHYYLEDSEDCGRVIVVNNSLKSQ